MMQKTPVADNKNTRNNPAESPTQPLTPYIPIDPVQYITQPPIDRAIIQAKLDNPAKPLSDIGRELVEQGHAQHPKTIYKRLKRGDYLRREIREVECETILRT